MTAPNQIFPPNQTPNPFNVQRWRPAPILSDQNLDLAIKTAFDNTSNLESTSPQSPVALHGSQISSGAVVVTGVMKGVATGLGTLSNVVGSVDTGGTPNSFTWSVTPSTSTPGTFDVYIFQPTSSSITTPVQSSSPVTFRWLAWGTA